MGKLSPEHLKHLVEESAISPEIIERSGVYTMLEEEAEKEFFIKGLSGIAFPFYNFSDGAFLGFRLRVDNPHPDFGKYTQKKGQRFGFYFLLSEMDKIMSEEFRLFVTEGEKKYLSLLSNNPYMEGCAALAITGCWNYRDSSTNDVHESFKQIPLKNRKIYFVGDSDFFSNQQVFLGYMGLIKYFVEKGAIVHFIDLRIDNTDKKIGLDDFIVSEGIDAFLERLKKPYRVFQNFDPLLLPEEKPEKLSAFIKELFEKAVLEDDEIIISAMLNTLKEKHGLLKADLKKMFQAEKRKWNQVEPLPKGDGKVVIHNSVTQTANETCQMIAKVLGKAKTLYLNAVQRVFYEQQEKDGKIYFRVISGAEALSAVSARHVDYQLVMEGKDGKLSIVRQDFLPPRYLEAILSNPSAYHSFQELEAIPETPILLNGEILSQQGYHQEPKVFINCESIQASNDLTHINVILNSFPFEDSISRENALLLFLTHALGLREYIGEHPMFLIIANAVNQGKTTLGQITSIIAFSIVTPTLKFNENNDEENEKVIATAIQSLKTLFFDNLRSTKMISSAILEKILTDKIIRIRKLGTNSVIETVNDLLVIMTVNNATFSQDLLARAVTISLSSNSSTKIDPSFDVIGYVKKHRLEIIAELVGLAERWILAGRPEKKVKFPKFPRWANQMCGILSVSGFNSALGNYENSMIALDPVLETVLSIALDEIKADEKSFVVKNVSGFLHTGLFDSLDDFKNKSSKGKETKLGSFLRKHLNRTIRFSYNEDLYELLITELVGGSNKQYKIENMTSMTSIPQFDDSKNNLLKDQIISFPIGRGAEQGQEGHKQSSLFDKGGTF